MPVIDTTFRLPWPWLIFCTTNPLSRTQVTDVRN